MPGRKELSHFVNEYRSSVRTRPGPTSTFLTKLSGMLMSDIDLSNRTELFVLPDGITASIPYNALTLPNLNDSPLINHVTVTVVPSAALLLRPLVEQQGNVAMIFADPVYGRNDPRAPRHSPPSILQRLSQSGVEAQSVASILAKSNFFVQTYKGFQANRQQVLRSDLSHVQVLHFATHGVVDELQPQASGLVLSSVSQSGGSQTGLLSLAEIYDLELNAELVVLSACDTALGKDIVGEGAISIARGFLVSGAQQVIATLWAVEDNATRLLMEEFYREWTEGLSVAEALRRAQIRLSQTRRYQSARYWGAFVVVGSSETNRSYDAVKMANQQPTIQI